MEQKKEMQLSLQMVSGYGAEFNAWRMPGADPAAYTNIDSYVERAKLAEQGQPVIFQAGGGQEGLELAGRFASGIYANPYDIQSAQEHRQAIRQSAIQFGRNPDDIKIFAGFMFSLGATEEEALMRRKQLMDFNPEEIPGRVSYLGSMINVPLSIHSIDMDQPLAAELLQRAYPSPMDPRAPKALQLLQQGLSVRDVLAHGVINYHPVVAGTPVQVADFLEEWFLAGACDGFSIVPDASFDGVADFVHLVVPILQERGVFHKEYEGSTLREHMGVPYQYGV